jgi:hypothetical protein
MKAAYCAVTERSCLNAAVVGVGAQHIGVHEGDIELSDLFLVKVTRNKDRVTGK